MIGFLIGLVLGIAATALVARHNSKKAAAYLASLNAAKVDPRFGGQK